MQNDGGPPGGDGGGGAPPTSGPPSSRPGTGGTGATVLSRLRRAVLGGLGPYGVAVLVLAACYPYAALLDRNSSELTIDDALVRVVLVTLVLVVAVNRLVLAVRPRANADRVALATAAVTVWLFSFSTAFSEGLRNDRPAVTLVVWALVALALARLVRHFASSASFRQFALIFLAGITAVHLVGFAGARATAGGEAEQAADRELLPGAVPAEEVDDLERPNVYWIVLDEYGRGDQLEEVLGLDNGDALAALEARGFDIGTSSYTSYPVTALALSSILSMDYVAESDDDVRRGPFVHTAAIRGDSAVADEFTRLGYDTVYAPAGVFNWSHCDADHVDSCLPPIRQGLALDEFERTVLNTTPLSLFVNGGRIYTTPEGMLDELYERHDPDGTPFFFFGHVLSPHHPYRYGPECQRRAVPEEGLDEDLYRREVTCLNQEVLASVDRIIEVDPTAIIVVQGDHGTKFLREGEWDDAQRFERFAVLDAQRLPPSCPRPPEDEPLSTVNTFRIVLGCIEGREFPLLDYRGFETWWDTEYELRPFDPPWMDG